MSPRRRGPLLAGIAGTLVVLVALVGVVLVVRPGPVAGWFGGGAPATSTPTVPPDPPAAPVLAAVPGGQATEAGVRARIEKLVTGAGIGGRLSVSVTDVETGQPLYLRNPDNTTVPASTTKLVTALAVLEARGPAHRIPTRVVAGEQPGEVVLIGGGDPTLSVAGKGSYPAAARLDRLAEQVKAALGGVAPTRVVVDSSLFTGDVYGPGWDADIATGGFAAPVTALMTDGGRVDPKETSPAARHRQPEVAAGRQFAKLLGLPARAVEKGTAPYGTPPGDSTAAASGGPESGSTPSGAAPGSASLTAGTELGRVESPPMARLVEIMLTDSDNVLAEALARQVALARGEPASYRGAAAAVDQVLADLGLPADESDLADGSGLSRRNRLTPSLLTDLLAFAAADDRPQYGAIFSGLPVGGWSGTLSYRFQHESGSGDSGVGVVRAKTGTLSGVHAMSGVLVTTDGQALAFALLADGVTAGTWDAQVALDAIAAALATCGC